MQHSEALPVACDARGVPLLRTLPDILGKLEDGAQSTRAAGALCIATLIDGTSGLAAFVLLPSNWRMQLRRDDFH